tara:strand:+ start:3048 stop:3521 length:474 start_codon:yes stop_codon:yes gene_type:complete
MPLLILLGLFIVVPLIEVFVFIEVGGVIGAWWTVLLCLVTAFAGAMLVRMQGRAVMASAQEALNQGRMPATEAFDGICILMAGFMLLTPGFFTDAAGFMLLTPPIRSLMRHLLARRVETFSVNMRAGPGGPVMDGEWETVDDPPAPANDIRLTDRRR